MYKNNNGKAGNYAAVVGGCTREKEIAEICGATLNN